MFCQFPISLFPSLLPLETTPNPEVMQLQGVIQDLENQIEEHKSKILSTANAVLKVRTVAGMDIALLVMIVLLGSLPDTTSSLKLLVTVAF